MAHVALEQVSKSFFPPGGGRIRAVDGVSLAVADGEWLTLVGPSGSGKTTLLRLIAGLESPDSGVIRIGERVVNTASPAARNVAMVFQRDALFPHLTARENLALGPKLRGCPPDEIARRTAQIASWLGLEECLERRPGELSGGERQRVALGRALAVDPGVLLLDEPLVHLDAPLRRQLRRDLLRLHGELRLTLVLVTHDPVEALALGRRVAVMRAGVIEQVGMPEELRARPASPFVAEFFAPDML